MKQLGQYAAPRHAIAHLSDPHLIAEGGLQGVVEVYPANHGWATPGSPQADAASTARVSSELLGFFKAKL